MDQVFISYRHNDQIDLFQLLLHTLREEGYEGWTDNNITPGEAWTKTIDNAIRDSFALIVIMTKQAQESQYVTYEWSYALGAQKPIITMLVDKDVDLHPRLTEYQYSDFTDGARPWDEIRNGLKRIKQEWHDIQVEQAFRWMQDGDSELEHDNIAGALDSYEHAYNLANERLKARIGYKMSQLYIRRIEKTKDKDAKAALLEKAEALLDTALQIRADYDAARAYFGYIYRLKRDVVTGDSERQEVLDLARRQFKQALQNQPDLIDDNGESWWNTYGGVLRRLGDMVKPEDNEAAMDFYDQAIDAYQQATEFGKKSSYPYGNLAILHMLKGDRDNMIANYSRVEYYPPNDAGDFWSQGDQIVAYLLKADMDNVEARFRLYDAFAPPYARETLVETLRSVAETLGAQNGDPVQDFLGRLEATF